MALVINRVCITISAQVKLTTCTMSWTLAESGVGGGSQREMMRLKKTNQQLSEENNLLKLKVDILLDMVRVRLFRTFIAVPPFFCFFFFLLRIWLAQRNVLGCICVTLACVLLTNLVLYCV